MRWTDVDEWKLLLSLNGHSPCVFSENITLESDVKFCPVRTICWPPSTEQRSRSCLSTAGSSWAERWAVGIWKHSCTSNRTGEATYLLATAGLLHLCLYWRSLCAGKLQECVPFPQYYANLLIQTLWGLIKRWCKAKISTFKYLKADSLNCSFTEKCNQSLFSGTLGLNNV